MSYPYSGVDLRRHPEAYEIGRGEQGVFHAEPYKGELLQLWSFKDARAAKKSADEIYGRFLYNRSDYTDDDLAHMRRVVGYVRRHQAQKPKGDVENSN